MLRCRKRVVIGPHRPASPQTYLTLARLTGAHERRPGTNRMTLRQLGVSRRSLTIAAALLGLVSLAIGAHAALNKRSFDAAKAAAAAQIAPVANKASRLALVIGNGHYP